MDNLAIIVAILMLGAVVFFSVFAFVLALLVSQD
jgi:hypothetical protein